MIRYLFIGFLLATLSGCSTVSKTELRDIFSDIRDEEFNAAEEKFNQVADQRFSTYDDRIIDGTDRGFSGTTVKWYLENAASYISGCRTLINRVSEIRTEKDWDEDRLEKAKSEVDSISNDFDRTCLLEDDRSGREELLDGIKKISSIDLTEKRPKFKQDFESKKKDAMADLLSMQKKSDMQKESAAREQEQYESSAEFYQKKMCELSDLILQAKRRIAQENEIGKNSGVVDALVLHRNGKRIQTFGTQLDTVKNQYRSRFGKNWSEADCK